jgi:hypothetical protein
LGLEESLFPQTSRYHGLRVEKIQRDGKEIAFIERRFVPSEDDFEEVRLHTVVQGDRLDNLAQRYFGDPELVWRLCDSNGAMDPAELTDTIGRRLRITLPLGVPGAPRA